jgi:putative ABC transport system substrate-binding protein
MAGMSRIPAIYPRREFAEASGFMSCGYDIADAYRETGRYAGSILTNGEKPADSPVIRPTKYELVIHLKAEFITLLGGAAGWSLGRAGSSGRCQ